ncbi:MAG: twin arginine-targeting protein translocase TatC [Bdellovibrionales bacterium RIFOXYD12_FULL_39_22]|nr:MAG: twin arginine-targeting protein translocase TatC [Bdellovibrionales bacterium RIFOXYB1_FULL_39_21]OFZ42623.1 MAG: twin arginine-targeting protein translocase TatC [Bdellovibrionales bacterium RIFOXYC12_FULL_39_17]OFZ47109.1 MAG: twin arginine-targeting protein translocase TatC [Bdellovibrionales bacterium RIFOXYC1_FULL_39_130]OFZ75357.1 MAG: twin arginine-targeting protein translocase TatC [Bdellovibrionales bacterium RIFOXYD1_FULL_39_84]OFZ93308.1 MAG: twin arginine-targeting protein t
MKEMPISEHLTELRTRIIRIAIIIIISFFICYAFTDTICEFLLAPVRASLGPAGKIVFLGILDKLTSYFQVAFWAAIIFSSPLWFNEIWQFIRPALHPHEEKVVRPFMLIGFVLFWLGILFGLLVVFPLSLKLLMEFGVGDVAAMLGLKEYLLLASKVLVFLGLMFQLPNIILILDFVGIINLRYLKEIRRYVYVVFSIIAAILTPPDIFTMLLMWIPLIALYEIGIFLVFLFGKKT